MRPRHASVDSEGRGAHPDGAPAPGARGRTGSSGLTSAALTFSLRAPAARRRRLFPHCLARILNNPFALTAAQEHPEVDWEAFGVLVDWDDIPTLHERLAALSLRDVARKRAAMARVWPRLLWSGLYGTSYLGEGAEADAFESLIDVLRVRLRAMAVRRSSGG